MSLKGKDQTGKQILAHVSMVQAVFFYYPLWGFGWLSSVLFFAFLFIFIHLWSIFVELPDLRYIYLFLLVIRGNGGNTLTHLTVVVGSPTFNLDIRSSEFVARCICHA